MQSEVSVSSDLRRTRIATNERQSFLSLAPNQLETVQMLEEQRLIASISFVYFSKRHSRFSVIMKDLLVHCRVEVRREWNVKHFGQAFADLRFGVVLLVHVVADV